MGGELRFDELPEFGQNGDLVPKYDIRTPTRNNHDLTIFKNFNTVGEQKLERLNRVYAVLSGINTMKPTRKSTMYESTVAVGRRIRGK